MIIEPKEFMLFPGDKTCLSRTPMIFNRIQGSQNNVFVPTIIPVIAIPVNYHDENQVMHSIIYR